MCSKFQSTYLDFFLLQPSVWCRHFQNAALFSAYMWSSSSLMTNTDRLRQSYSSWQKASMWTSVCPREQELFWVSSGIMPVIYHPDLQSSSPGLIFLDTSVYPGPGILRVQRHREGRFWIRAVLWKLRTEYKNATKRFLHEVKFPKCFLNGYATFMFSSLLSSCEVDQASSGKVIGARMLCQSISASRLCIPKGSLSIANLL